MTDGLIRWSRLLSYYFSFIIVFLIISHQKLRGFRRPAEPGMMMINYVFADLLASGSPDVRRINLQKR